MPFAFLVLGFLIYAAVDHKWNIQAVRNSDPTVHKIGNAFLNEFLLPFEFASVILLVVLVGAALVARREIGTRISQREES